jgi:hypothetical protein
MAPTRYGWLTGLAIGGAILVIAPIVHPLDASYLIPTHWKITLVTSGLASAIGAFLVGRRWVRWSFALAIGVMCAFVIRISIDISHDRTNHNLLPFELIIDFVSVFLCALVGAGMGTIVRRFADRPSEHGPYKPRWR